MASSTPHKILLETNEEGGRRPSRDSLLASVAITPGELLAVSSGAIIPHGSANGVAKPAMLAIEADFIDDPTADKIDHDYASGEQVNFIYPQPGDLVYAFIKASESITTGVTLLASDGAGALQAITVDASTVTGAVIGRAEETATIGVTRERKKVRIL